MPTHFLNKASATELPSTWMPESHEPPTAAPGVNVQPAVVRSSCCQGDDCASARPHSSDSRPSAIRMRDIPGLLASRTPARIGEPLRVQRHLRDDDGVARLQVDRFDLTLEGLLVIERNRLGARPVRAQDVDVLHQQVTRLTGSLKLLEREQTITRKLYEQKVVPEIEMLRLDRQATEMKGQLAEAQSKIANITTSFRSQADEDLAKSRGDLAVLDENIKSAQDRVRRTDLRAPVHGIINKLNVNTIGAVVQPGANLMDIVPLDDSLLVEGRIRPQDIAFIRPNQDAVVKITAYDSSVYGSLKGKVERISADTIVDDKADKSERPENFYRVTVRTEKNHLGTEQKPLPIIPGMVATVEVLTGEKSVLDYLMKPARTLRDDALREH